MKAMLFHLVECTDLILLDGDEHRDLQHEDLEEGVIDLTHASGTLLSFRDQDIELDDEGGGVVICTGGRWWAIQFRMVTESRPITLQDLGL